MEGRPAARTGPAVAERPRLPTSGTAADPERRRTPIALLVALLAIVVSLYLALLLDDSAATWLIREEHPVELLGALSLLASSIACLVLWGRTRGDVRWPKLRRLSLLALGALFFFGFGEELSWGERILGFAPPESLSEANRQDEATVHNLDLFSGSLDPDRLFQLFWLVMGVLVPIASLWRAARRLLQRLVPVLALGLVPLFVLNQLLTRGFDELFAREPERYKSSVFAPGHAIFETKETVACILLAAGFWLLVRQWQTEPLMAGGGPPEDTPHQPAGG
jgi:hypothetical protein